jgi:hypothetical protein
MDTPAHDDWREVGYLEFDRYLREYPRPLVADPPLNRPAQIREWFDVALGSWPANAVARQYATQRGSYQVKPVTTRSYARSLQSRPQESIA